MVNVTCTYGDLAIFSSKKMYSAIQAFLKHDSFKVFHLVEWGKFKLLTKLNPKIEFVLLKDVTKVDWGNTELTKTSYLENGDYLGVSAAGMDGRINHFEHRVGTIVISAIGALCGKVFFPREKFTAIKNTITLTPLERKLNSYYLYSILSVNPFNRRGAGQPFISKGDTEKLQIPFPPLAIQEEIAKEIEGYQKIIDGARQVVENYKPRIDIDPEWEKIKLREVCEIKAGGTPLKSNKEFWDGDIPWYSSGELNETYTSDPREFITKKGLQNSNATLFPEGSLLIGMYDTAAFKMSLLDREATFNQAVCGLKPSDEVDLYFIMLFFNMNKEEYLSHRVGVRQRNLNKGFISEIQIPKISLETQRQIVVQIEKEQ